MEQQREHNARVKELVRPHVESFDFFLGPGKDLLCRTLEPVEITNPTTGDTLQLRVVEIHIGDPCRATSDLRLTPADCREAQMTYSAPATVKISAKIFSAGEKSAGRKISDASLNCPIGRIPLMVGCCRCPVGRARHEDLPKLREDVNEVGGYFIVNGNEKMLRMLIYPRPNHPLAITRHSWIGKGPRYTKFGCSVRCMRDDSTTQSVTVHALSDGDVTVRFIFRKQEFFIPAVLLIKSLTGLSDRGIYERLVNSAGVSVANLTTSAEMLLASAGRSSSIPPCRTAEDGLRFLGSRFKVTLRHDAGKSDAEIGRDFVEKFIFVHLPGFHDKANLLVFMIQKLWALVYGEVDEDNVDAPAYQAALLPGHLYLSVFKDCLQNWLLDSKIGFMKDLNAGKKVDLSSETYVTTKLKGTAPVGRKLDNFLATGTYNSRTGIDLMQVAGFTVMADRLNFNRFMSHFQSIHRGAFYAQMKTTAIRKLLPEAWGFLCPVHTPDGAPCGLLNHIAVGCRPLGYPALEQQNVAVLSALAELGVCPIEQGCVLPASYTPVIFNGRLVGHVRTADAPALCEALRLMKVKQCKPGVPDTLEIAHVDGRYGTGFPAVYLSSDMTRMVRPVLHVATNRVEWIGVLEQLFLDIALPKRKDDSGDVEEEGEENVETTDTSHRELTAANMLSALGNMTPFSDMNPSARNIYQCQMAKQTLGTPCHSYAYRADNKLLRLHYPQKPICHTKHQRPYLHDEYPSGINSVVAVISYTGYDMEDALILNKSSVERGFAHASMYKTYVVSIDRDRHAAANKERLCGVDPRTGKPPGAHVDAADGLARPGEALSEGDAFYGIVSDVTHDYHAKRLALAGESVYVDTVRVMPSYGPNFTECQDTFGSIRKANVKLRLNRNPVIGDKFAARHGQKGVLSRLWPERDMPFSESGMTPDVIINPHAFPSRMTIGMLVESMAGKSGSIHGIWQDCSTFRFSEKNTALAHFGEELVKAGYQYYGTEPMYSGVTGELFEAEIFLGIVHYQRLVHQVKDKFQARSVGPVSELTQQPVHGRKRGGGIRLGEMERDSLIAHGTSMLLQDRLFNCSDRSPHFVCRQCGSVISALPISGVSGGAVCKQCSSQAPLEPIALPFVMRYLAAELAAMNIRLTVLTK